MNPKAPTLSEARKAFASPVRSNLFDVQFTDIPLENISQEEKDRLRFLCAATQIPGRDQGGYNSWPVNVLGDVKAFDIFCNWFDKSQDDYTLEGQAVVNLYTTSGDLECQYTISGLAIVSVSPLCFEWEIATEIPKFTVNFAFKKVSRTF